MCIHSAWLKCLYARVFPIFISSMMSVWSSVLCCFLVLSLSVFPYLFSSLSYLYSDLHSSFHVDSAEGNTRCAFAQWGVLLRGDTQPSQGTCHGVGYASNRLQFSHSSTEAEIIALDAWFTHGWNSSSWSFGFGFWSVSFFPKPTQQHQRSSTRKPVA